MFPMFREGTQQAVAYTATPGVSTAFAVGTYAVLVTTSSAAHIRVGSNPTAVITDFLLKAGDPPLVVGVAPGQKISVIQDTAGGSMYLVEVCA
jgi:hypothetical protein